MRKQYHFRPSAGGTLIWDVHKLVALSSELSEKEFALRDIKELDEPYWFGNGVDIPTCKVIADHAKLIDESDLSHPIILSSDGRVMDGMHRVAKAYMRGDKSIIAVQFLEDPEPDYIDTDPEDLPYESPA